ncbi:hypothetical protein COCSADRAFT_80909 [Bipolaris sorokiniana ND90Pr]|uniref:HECT-type E3 ubiquitin transferase n=1 Tax=Cochliobolus sativus (strain ND90Pr / ATCC 201652) TaxID=665912 RepID=M2TGA6_COCSN|nr:uncharacterized protein COCSADRAFT_80909 [Bipolaris sorokiniana ND90Pr]EMD68276.1 hypothetical protein COCSADRAFT_80909 [Bipolaris sorokiniana ND90Pr]
MLAEPPRRPSRALDSTRLSNVVEVQDPRRVLECSQTERQRQFQHLVRHYLSQILYGCKSPYCTTPTCLSSHKRNASKPHRPPTHLTATALAHYLASQDDPQRELCPHDLNIAPSSFELGGSSVQSTHGLEKDSIVHAPSAQQARQHGDKHVGTGQGDTHVRHQPQQEQVSTMSELTRRQQVRKDPKALGQNLYDSLAMIYSYTKQIPTSASILASLHPSHDASPQNEHNPRTNGHDRNTSVELIPSSEHISLAHVNAKPRTECEHSQRACDKATTGKPTAQVVHNGQHIHRIPYHPPNSKVRSQSYTETDSTPSDGVTAATMLSISKSGRKSFTIGGANSVPSNDARKTPKALEIPEGDSASSNRMDNSIHVLSSLSCSILDELKEEIRPHGDKRPADFNHVVDFDGHPPNRRTKPIINRSLFYTLSDPETLLSSFRESSAAFKDSPLPHLDSHRLAISFRDWNRRNGALVFDSLCLSLEAMFGPPPELTLHKSPRLRPSIKNTPPKSLSGQAKSNGKSNTPPRYLSTEEAAHIVMICIHALTSLVPIGWPHTWAQIRKLRSWGIIVPHAVPNTDNVTDPYMDIIDELEYEPALRLASRLCRAIGTRCCFEHILNSLRDSDEESPTTDQSLLDIVINHLEVVERVALTNKRKLNREQDSESDPGWTVTATFVEWLRTVIIKEWDSKAEINKWTSVGTAVIMLDKLHSRYQSLNLRPKMFEMPILNERLNAVSEPAAFVAWKEKPNTLHILQYTCLFSAQHLVAYFRTINFSEMMKHYDHTMRTQQMQASLKIFLREPYWWVIKSRLKVTLSEYLVLDVSREDPLKDTLDQLWGQDKRMLLKPLKVKMGHGEGEIGVDHGGVTYEFFRVILSEAFKPQHGMFTIDPQTRMTWFQPKSLEPLWKFEMLGILFSLAVYNGITLPVTFPLAFYEYLQTNGSPRYTHAVEQDALEYIRDGWPALADSFQELLSWSDSDVEDVFMREYVFSYELYGQRIDHNLKHPFSNSNPSEEPDMITNENRTQYIRDYIRALTHDSVAPQLASFLKGFLSCIKPKSLHLFTPATLRALVEGTQHISIADLKRCAKYEEGYSTTNPTIQTFWEIVEKYSQEDCRHLLEFVTASDRVPVTGYESITFHIARIGGAPHALPSSSTCFGKLYLPEYRDRGVMEGKMLLAIRSSKGFGLV